MKEEKRLSKDSVEWEKMQELIRCGKDLELGFNFKKCKVVEVERKRRRRALIYSIGVLR